MNHTVLDTLASFAVVALSYVAGARAGVRHANADRTRYVGDWVSREFGQALARPKAYDERGLRAVEEVVELAQSLGTPVEMVRKIVERTYAKEPGKHRQELAQAFLTLLAVADATGVDLDEAFDREWARIDAAPPGYFADRMRRKVEHGHAIETETKDGKRSSPL